ncbi:leucine-rich repeat-containing protein 69 isoform X2 [Hemicordylus capensis]|uniref:leucine-rich repeat-containing protein 69 isoform X2 n=1 Tax=Hemicordylus capensis TaxID=884348 RepID=UPI002304188C|nr:leucine-rich repeat-containing protein 69 isoform X2 [Hemicordylus capensis]
MAEGPLLRALRGGPGTRSLSLSARRLRHLPRGLGNMKGLEGLSLRDNRLSRLPQDMKALSRKPNSIGFELENLRGHLIHSVILKLTVLNLGNNIFEEVPEQLKYLTSLKKLHLFGNKITRISPLIFDGLKNLVLLNLNNNQLSNLPVEIHRLENLECVSLDNNQLQCIPKELCYLRKLRKLYLSHNSIITLPEEIGYLTKLKVLILSRNQIEELPDGLSKLKRLRVLDVAGNNIQLFPTAMDDLTLEELYCEDNPLLEKYPVHAIQEKDVLTLKEITARFILAHLKDKDLFLQRAIKKNSEVQKILSEQRECVQCGYGFLSMWLECVQFVDIKQGTKTSRNLQLLPVRALLCSYKCFNRRDRGLFGIALP